MGKGSTPWPSKYISEFQLPHLAPEGGQGACSSLMHPPRRRQDPHLPWLSGWMKPLIKQIVAIKYPGVSVCTDVEKLWFPVGKLSTMLCLPHPCWFTGTFNATFGARENMLMREGSGKRSVSSSQKTEHRDSGLSVLICNYTVHAPSPVGVIAQHSHVSG